MDREKLAKIFARLDVEQRADVLTAIVCSITGRKISGKVIYTDKGEELPFRDVKYFTNDMVSVLTAILFAIK